MEIWEEAIVEKEFTKNHQCGSQTDTKVSAHLRFNSVNSIAVASRNERISIEGTQCVRCVVEDMREKMR